MRAEHACIYPHDYPQRTCNNGAQKTQIKSLFFRTQFTEAQYAKEYKTHRTYYVNPYRFNLILIHAIISQMRWFVYIVTPHTTFLLQWKIDASRNIFAVPTYTNIRVLSERVQIYSYKFSSNFTILLAGVHIRTHNHFHYTRHYIAKSSIGRTNKKHLLATDRMT